MDYAQQTANGEIMILPSLLAADFGYLADGVRQAVTPGPMACTSISWIVILSPI